MRNVYSNNIILDTVNNKITSMICTLQKYLHMLYSIGDVSVVCAVYVYAYMYV